MGKAIPTQHPAVVLRSHYRQLRALLAIAMVAVVGLTAAVVILATLDERDTSAGSATQANAPGWAGGIRYDGGPEERTAPITSRSAPARLDSDSIQSPPGVRYDGGPEEGTPDVSQAQARVTQSQALPGLASQALEATQAPAEGTRYDGGPEEGSSGAGH
jgi:hypothetical protein